MRVPFLPNEIRSGKKYTLVLDLDETLVHYEEVSESLNLFYSACLLIANQNLFDF